MAKTLRLVLGFVLILLIHSCSNSNSLKLVEDGESNYEIVFLGSTTEQNYKSAEILQHYLQKISGIKLNLINESSQTSNTHKIYVGNFSDTNLDKHQVQIKTNEENLM